MDDRKKADAVAEKQRLKEEAKMTKEFKKIDKEIKKEIILHKKKPIENPPK